MICCALKAWQYYETKISSNLNVDKMLNSSRIVYNDLQAIAPEQYFKQITKRLAEIKAVEVSIVTKHLAHIICFRSIHFLISCMLHHLP